MTLAWGARVAADFRARAIEIAKGLQVDPSDLMGCMAWESGETFSASVVNAAGSGATGLIQFMPQTAAALGTSTLALGKMTAVQQLDWVEKYFAPRRGQLKNLGDLYMAILWPAGIGRPDDTVLFRRDDPAHPKLYLQNRGLDFNRDGLITRGECCAAVVAKRAKGLLAGNAWSPAPGAGGIA